MRLLARVLLIVLLSAANVLGQVPEPPRPLEVPERPDRRSPIRDAASSQTFSWWKSVETLNAALDEPDSTQDTERKTLDLMEQTLSHMSNGAITIAGWQDSLVLYQTLNITTSPWENRDIRSRYEKIKDWGSAIGGLVAAAAFLQKDSDSKDNMAAAGVGLIGASQLISQIFGKKVSRAYTANMVFLDMTLRAYDDLRAHRDKLTRAAEENRKELKPAVDAALAKFREAKGDKAKLDLLPDVLALLDQYQGSIERLLTINDDVQELASRALLNITVPKDVDTPELENVRKSLAQVAAGAKRWEADYEATVFAFFNVSAGSRGALTAAQARVQEKKK